MYGRHPIKKAETVELYKIALIEKTLRTKGDLEDIINHCNKQENIEGPVLKSILKSIVEKIQ